MDLPRHFTIRETSHRIHNPFDEVKLATLGAALHMTAGASVLDLACGSGELLATWARDYAIAGTGVDISTVMLAQARARAATLGVADKIEFIHANASGYVSDTRVDVAACVGATWIGDGVAGTIELLDRSLRPGGIMLIGEPYWIKEPPDDATVAACHASSRDEFANLPDLVRGFGELGWDLIEMVLANPDSWDRYHGAQWRNIRLFLDANPDDELAPMFRAELDKAPLEHLVCRDFLGWGVFALMKR